MNGSPVAPALASRYVSKRRFHAAAWTADVCVTTPSRSKITASKRPVEMSGCTVACLPVVVSHVLPGREPEATGA